MARPFQEFEKPRHKTKHESGVMNGRLGNKVGFTGQNPALRTEHSVGSPQHRASAGLRLRLEFREDLGGKLPTSVSGVEP